MCDVLNIFEKKTNSLLTNGKICGIIIAFETRTVKYLGVAQLVARYLGVVEAAGSSPVTQTRNRES